LEIAAAIENGFDAGATEGDDDGGVNEAANGFKAGGEKDNFGSLKAEVLKAC
jgi:hypothetical protein